MCGILGIISNSKLGISEADFSHALKCLEHRGPDDQGLTEISGNGFLGMTRLSIIDLSDSGHQPMPYLHQGRGVKIVFNGEVYNYLELRKELADLGYGFNSTSDTEVIAASYLAWGKKCLERFNGMFSFVIWDENAKSLFAGRDRLGKKPFFYVQEGDRFSFASEIKALRALGVRPRIDKNKFQKYLLLPEVHYFGKSDTFYENIKSLPAGAYLKWQAGALSVTEWWSPEDPEIQNMHENSGIYDKIHSLLKSAVELRLRSDVPVALALSGGVDSSAILSLMPQLQKNGNILHTFTVCHPGRETDERDLVEALVKSFPSLKIESHFFNFPQEIGTKDLEEFIATHDEPVRNFDVYNQFFLMKKIHESGIKVLLSGQGADELFWGYPRYYLKASWSALKSLNLPYFLECLKYVSRFHNISLIKAVRKIIFSSVSRSLKSEREKRIIALFKKPASFTDEEGHLEDSSLKNFQIQELTETHLPSLLRDEDRNSMRFSIESRAPFLDFRLVELALGLPASFNLKNGFTKFALRKAFESYLPKEVSWRKSKSGLYEKRTIKYVKNFSEIARKTILTSPFLKNNLNLDLIPYDDLELVWRLYNVAVLDLRNEN